MEDVLDLHDCPPKMPLIGDAVPEFVASTTSGTVNFPGDFAGKWIVLFSHPSDFTPVCTSEFIAFQQDLAAFNELNTQLIGLSVGALSSHLAWFDAIAKMPDGEKISFPLIDDIDMHVAKLYGMIQPNASSTATVRAVFIIDPHGIIRAILYYPATLGRNITEIQRMIIGLQTADAFGVAMPANWMPGDKVLTLAPMNIEAMRRHRGNSPWFMTYKSLPQDEIYEKICKKSNCSK